MTTSISTIDDADPPALLIFLMMLLAGIAVSLKLVPIWLALGIGTVVPPVTYLCYVFNKEGYRAGDYGGGNITSMFAANSFLLAFGVAVRMWREYALIDHRPFAFTCLGIAAALTLLVQFTRQAGGAPPFRFLLFAVYFGGVLGLANTHFDNAAPRYVQGRVTEIDIRKDRGRGKPRYYTVKPFLLAPSGDIEVPPYTDSPVQVGDPFCTLWHPGALGFAWYQTRIGLCPAAS